jgi:hypothetical protein
MWANRVSDATEFGFSEIIAQLSFATFPFGQCIKFSHRPRRQAMGNQDLGTIEKDQKTTSGLVRRLVNAEHDPGKKRVRQWLSNIDDRRLSQFGLTPEDIAALRGRRCQAQLNEPLKRAR